LTKATRCFFKPSSLLWKPDNVGRKKAFSSQKSANMAEKRLFPFHFNFQKRRFSMFIGLAEIFSLAVFPASAEGK
jgi:hypothetical protein